MGLPSLTYIVSSNHPASFMAIEEVKLPELSDGVDSGDILELYVSEGDSVTEGQDILEIETDKATVPVSSSVSGKVVEILVKQGDKVPIGGLLIKVDSAASPSDAKAPSKPEPEQAQPASEPQPPQAESTREEIDRSPPAETPPTVPSSSSPPAAPVASASVPQTSPTPTSPSVATAPTGGDSAGMIPAGPAIRRLSREMGVDLTMVTGTGEGGRITREDVMEVVRQANAAVRQAGSTMTVASGQTTITRPQETKPSSGSASLPGTADQDDFGPIRVERMTKIRRTIAAQMHASWSSVPRVTNFDDADITDLEQLRSSSKEDYAAQGIKLTTMPFLIKAVATALRHHPAINAVIDDENEQVIYKDYVNIGIAVDTDRGLVVPVMRDVDRQGVPDVARGLAEMAGKVRGGQFGVNDLRGGTFTISNLGAIGGQYSTPIVNIPEVAILLVGRSRKLPVVMPDDSIKPRLMMPLSLSYDHRLVDGGTAARFLNDVIGYLESPSRLLLAL